jgi:hypothetical protein
MFFSVCGALFKGLCFGRVFHRVARSSLLPRHAKAAQGAADRAGMVGHLPALGGDPHQIVARVCGQAVLVGVGACDHDLDQLGFLLLIEMPRTAGLGAIVEPLEPLGVVALDRIAQRLVRHVRQPGCLAALETVDRIGDPQHSHRRPAVVLAPRQVAKLLGREFRADQKRACGHAVLRINAPADIQESHPERFGNPIESVHRFGGISHCTCENFSVVPILDPSTCRTRLAPGDLAQSVRRD